MVMQMKDSAYSVTTDGQALVYNARNWKIEMRYMPDYQLNTFEFPEDSKQGELSGNPFTYANWVDPQLGFTPRRFTVFKITLYNYINSKINFDPELSSLQSDRGDNFLAYAREKKNARNFSIEEYFTKRKGKSGVEDDVFETRMGICRRTMFYYGKPIYKGDSREGLLVYDPIQESVEKIKIDVKNFILSYNENNEPNEFKDLVFYFAQQPLSEELLQQREQTRLAISDTALIQCTIAQVKYQTKQSRIVYEQPFNPLPHSVPNLVNYIIKNSRFRPKYVVGAIDEDAVRSAPMMVLTGSGIIPEFSPDFTTSVADYLNAGGLLVMDNCYFQNIFPFSQFMEELLTDVTKKVNGKCELRPVPIDHPVFKGLKNFDQLPLGYDDQLVNLQKATVLKGFFINNRLAAIISVKGYPVLWAAESPSPEVQQALDFGINLINYSLTMKREMK
jgi:hypothetical protein